MEINIHNINNEYAEVLFKMDNTTIESGVLTEKELQPYAEEFIGALYSILDEMSDNLRQEVLRNNLFQSLATESLDDRNREDW